MITFNLNGVRTIAPEENCPRLVLGFRLGLGIGLGAFSSKDIVVEPF